MAGLTTAVVGGALLGGAVGGLSKTKRPQLETTQTLPDYVTRPIPGVLEEGLEAYDRPFPTYGTEDRIAGLSPDELAAYELTRGQTGQYQDLLGKAGVNLEEIQRRSLGGTSFEQLQPFMDPYQQGVTDIAKREALRDYDVQKQRIGDVAATSGAFGGSRHGIVESEAERNIQQRLSDIQTQGLSQNYMQAQDLAQRGLSRGLAGAGQTAGLAGLSQSYGFTDAAALESIGGTQRGLTQAGKDFEYDQAMREFDYGSGVAPSKLGLLGTAGNLYLSGTVNQMSSPQPNAMGRIAGGMMSGASMGSSLFGGGGAGGLSALATKPMQTMPGGQFGGGYSNINPSYGMGSQINWQPYAEGGLVQHFAEGGMVKGYAEGGLNSYPSSLDFLKDIDRAEEAKDTSFRNPIEYLSDLAGEISGGLSSSLKGAAMEALLDERAGDPYKKEAEEYFGRAEESATRPLKSVGSGLDKAVELIEDKAYQALKEKDPEAAKFYKERQMIEDINKEARKVSSEDKKYIRESGGRYPAEVGGLEEAPVKASMMESSSEPVQQAMEQVVKQVTPAATKEKSVEDKIMEAANKPLFRLGLQLMSGKGNFGENLQKGLEMEDARQVAKSSSELKAKTFEQKARKAELDEKLAQQKLNPESPYNQYLTAQTELMIKNAKNLPKKNNAKLAELALKAAQSSKEYYESYGDTMPDSEFEDIYFGNLDLLQRGTGNTATGASQEPSKAPTGEVKDPLGLR